MKSMVKVLITLVFGALLWTNGGVVKSTHAEAWGDGVCKAGWYVDDRLGCVSPDGTCNYYPNGASNPDCSRSSNNSNSSGGSWNVDIPARQKPSSYGAVAWDGKSGLYGSSTKQSSKQASIDAAMQKCGSATCKLQTWYANQCVAVAYGVQSNGKYFWVSELATIQRSAEKKAKSQCGKGAKNCQILLSECSPAGEIDTSSQTTQYKGLGE